MTGLAQRYLTAVAAAPQHDLDVLPAVLASACVEVLPVEGAALCLTQRLRVPLGASDEEARRAERLQITVGEGPCLAAMAAGQPLAADAVMMQQRWPIFASELLTTTRYKATVSVPLAWPGQLPFGALDLYSHSWETESWLVGEEVRFGVAAQITLLLLGRAVSSDSAAMPLPDWLMAPAAADRMRVWQAAGLLMAATELSEADAVAALRSYAYSHDQTIDEVALNLSTRQLPLDHVWPAPTPP